MKALVTGFDPFGDSNANASIEAVRRLPSRIGGVDVTVAELPTSFARSIPALKQAIARARPRIVLCVGEAGDRGALSVERVAVNLQDARIPDNDGAAPADKPVLRGGPAAYFSGLPVRAIVTALQRESLPAEASMSAGTFVCNHVFYGLLHFAAARRGLRAGFVHVPSLSTRAMTVDDMARGIGIVLEVAARKRATR